MGYISGLPRECRWYTSGDKERICQKRLNTKLGYRGYPIIGFGSGFTADLGSDSLGKSNDLGVSSVSRIHCGFGFIVNPDPDPIIE